MKVLVVAAEAILTQTLTLMPTPDFLEEFPIILIPTQSSIFKSYPWNKAHIYKRACQ